MEKEFDIAIIGAGPAGFAAAITAKTLNPQISVLLIEKMETPAKKLSASGNGRGNLSNRECQSFNEVLQFFSENGIAVRLDDAGRLYPYSEEAKSVANALVTRAKGLGIVLLTNSEVKGVEVKGKSGFRIFIDEKTTAKKIKSEKITTEEIMAEEIIAKKLLIATGGKSFGIYGSTGDGYAMARNLGHTVTPIIPALTAIEVVENLKDIKGVRVKAEASLLKDGEVIFRQEGEIQFKEDSISGICVMDMSSYLPVTPKTEEANQKLSCNYRPSAMKGCKIFINMVKDFDTAQLIRFLKIKSNEPGVTAASLLETLIKKALAHRVLKEAGIDEKKSASELEMSEIVALANMMRGFPLSPSGRKGWKDAQVTKGGVPLDEIDSETMESKIVDNLYFAGEILDYDGPCGGYNLHNAWLNGIKAGRSMAKRNEKCIE
jgi:predicted Rossmann fold flavoprotein